VTIKGGYFHWGTETSTTIESTQAVREEEIEEEDLDDDDKKKALLAPQEVGKESTLDQHLTLKGIDLTVKHGEFVCIIGDVGSGKSSLLSALIGDMLFLDEYFVA